MRINQNLAALNSYRNLVNTNNNLQKSLERLSSGFRINRAGDDAAGLAISEKMRGQIKGLQQAQRNSQDAISLIQTAEGALSETHSILQRMRELAVQAASDTATATDRAEIQKEINQLSSEINRIGNTTEFNTRTLLKGSGSVTGVALAATSISGMTAISAGGATLSGGAVAYLTQSEKTFTFNTSGQSGETLIFSIQGQNLTLTYHSGLAAGAASGTYMGASGNAVAMASGAVTALNNAIAADGVLADNFTASRSGAVLKITAVASGDFDGAAGVIGTYSGTAANISASGYTQGENVAAAAAANNTDLTSLSGADAATARTNIEALVGKGWTIAGQQIEFYNAESGAYTGDAIGVNVSTALASGLVHANIIDILSQSIASQLGSSLSGVTLSYDSATANTVTVTAATAGTAGNSLTVGDAAQQTDTTGDFSATFQVGANQGQSFEIAIQDMRSNALSITATSAASGFTATVTVTNGTSSTETEYALDVSSFENATAAIDVVDNAIQTVSAERSKLGAYQNRLDHTIANLGTAAENLTAAESRIRDVDMAEEMMQFTKNQIISQAATAMLAQANAQPQQILQLLR